MLGRVDGQMRFRGSIGSILQFCIIFIVGISLPVAAGSFDLLLQGDWVYDDLALLAEASLMDRYSSVQELTATFPLTRYEVAMLVGDMLEQTGFSTASDALLLSPDLLVLKILEGSSSTGAVELSGELVAQARGYSKGALQAILRLAGEFKDELEVLGLGEDLRLAPRRIENRHGFTLKEQLGISIVSPGPTIWQVYGMEKTGKQPMGTSSTDAVEGASNQRETEDAHDVCCPVDLSVLAGAPPADGSDALSTYLPSDDESKDAVAGSLKLMPDMAGQRPVGLLTLYYLGTTF